jgi:hypothetical protein
VNTFDKLIAQVTALTRDHAQSISVRFAVQTRPRIAALLNDYAIVALREAAGQDVTTARIALANSSAQLLREEQATLELEARTLALRAAFAVIASLLVV